MITPVLLGFSTVLVYEERNRVVPHLGILLASIAVLAILVASFFLGYCRHHA